MTDDKIKRALKIQTSRFKRYVCMSQECLPMTMLDLNTPFSPTFTSIDYWVM